MKLTVLGEGGARSALLAKSLAYNARRIGLTEVAFLGSSADGLMILGEIIRYIFGTIRPDIQFSTTTDPAAALQDANHTITVLRVGGDESRTHDERTTLQHNTLGQETTGAGDLTMAMRSIPVTLCYCRLIKEHAAEDTILFNSINPSGLATGATVKSGFKCRVYGTYDAPSKLIHGLPATLGYEECDLSVGYYELNHFSRFIHFTVRGGEVTERLTASPELYQRTAIQYFPSELVRFCDNQLLNEYLYYYHYREVALRVIQEADETRGEQIAHINQEMREALRTVDAGTRPEAAFVIWMQHYLHRGNSYMRNESQQGKSHTREPLILRQFIEEPDVGGYAGMVLGILETVDSTTIKRIVVSIQNHDTLDLLHPDDVIEISCDLSRDGLKPVTSVKVSTARKNMIPCVKEYERLAVVAILQQDKSLAMRALMMHPLVGSYSPAKALVEAYLGDGQSAVWQ